MNIERMLESSIAVASPDERRINCFACNDDKYHMYVNTKKKVYYCQKCGISGKYSVQVSDAQGFTRVVRAVDIPVRGGEGKVRNLPLSDIWYSERDWNIDTPKGFKYLKSRGLTEDQIHKYTRVSVETTGQYRNTIIFPVYDQRLTPSTPDGFLSYFVARKYDGTEPKYINAPWPKEDTLFIAGSSTVQPYACPVIVEGVLDALAIERLEYIGVALLGKRANSKQLSRIARTWNKAIIYLDDDALSQAIKLKLELDTLGVHTALIRRLQDPADAALSSMGDLLSDLRTAHDILNKKS